MTGEYFGGSDEEVQSDLDIAGDASDERWDHGELGLEDFLAAQSLDLTTVDATQVTQSSATFDVLSLISMLQGRIPPSRLEIHSFSYLSCLLSLYRGHPASEWGYFFSAVPPTLPFSPVVDSALNGLVGTGLVLEFGHQEGREASMDAAAIASVASHMRTYRSTSEGEEELSSLRTLRMLKVRTEFLRAAAATAVFHSLPGVVNALSYEPQLAEADRTGSAALLMRKVTLGPLYEQFQALESVIGKSEAELIVPASLYLEFLICQASASDGDEARSNA